MKSLYERACLNQETERAPIWMMRQAGRYLPEYRAIREKYSFMEMIHTPELALEITLQPIRRFGFDAAILFSDILVTATASGSDLSFVEKKGPVISNPIRTASDLLNLKKTSATESLDYVLQAIKLLKPELASFNTPLIGFCGAPFTVASYMIEGGSSTDLTLTKTMIGNDPDTFQALLDHLTSLTIDYLNAQIAAGVNAVQIFDTWAGLLSFYDFKTYILPSLKTICAGLVNPNQIPVSLFCKYSANFGPLLAAELPIHVLSVDWQCSLSEMRQKIGPDIALQGNLDPGMLLASPDVLTKRVSMILDEMRPFKGFIFNLGHGVTPNISPDQVKRVVDLVKQG